MFSVLLVESAHAVAIPIRALLEQHEFRVEVVPGGDDARTRDIASYAAIVVDVQRGNRSAMELLEWLYREHPHVTGRVIVMTADDADAIVLELEGIGICDVIPKPVRADEILRAVRECMERSPALVQ